MAAATLPRMHVFRAVVASLALVLAGCGGDSGSSGEASAPKRTATPTTRAPTQTPAAVDEEPLPRDRLSRSQTALALTVNLTDAARYCVRKLGAETGVEQPPSEELRAAKDRLVSNAQQVAHDLPDLRVNGKPLREFLLSAADTMRNGECDTNAAARLEDIAVGL
jgi:hypothetical protein